MVDFKLLFYPDIVRKADLLRRRFKTKSNKSISCNLDENDDSDEKCRCPLLVKFSDNVCEADDDEM